MFHKKVSKTLTMVHLLYNRVT